MPTHARKHSPSRLLIITLFGASLALTGCYVGIEDEGLGEFGDEFGGTDESDAGETGGGDATSGGDASSGGDATSDGSTADGGTTNADGGTTDGGTTDGGTTDGGTTEGETTTTDGGTTTTDGGTSTTDGGTTDTTTDTGEPMAGDMPDNAYCNPVSNWSAQWIDLELQVLELTNQARAQGGNCGVNGNFAPSGPLTWEAHLTCAARVHSQDMAVNDFFDHTNLQGNGPGWRLDQAGYQGGAWGENIAAGYPDPEAVVQGWLDSDGHCANMLNGNYTLIGVGYAYDAGSSYGAYWTQTFGN